MDVLDKPLPAARSLEGELTRKETPPPDIDSADCTPTVLDGSRPGSRRMLPCRFGDYELLEEIARGGMGVVYKVRQRVGHGDRLVALKMIQSGRLDSREAVERFRQETRAAAILDHPGIVAVYDVGRIDEQLYFTMPLLAGGSLDERVREGPLPPRLAADIVRQVAQAVQHAHAHGIIHRDLKPANVPPTSLLTPIGPKGPIRPMGPIGDEETLIARITDFGIARMRESGLSVAGQAAGTPSYMPPEQARGQHEAIGPSSDVYGLGAILYCLLTGRPPFQAADPMETMRQVCTADPVLPRTLNPRLPRDLETICLKCLEKEPGKRYDSAADVAEELRRWQAGERIMARPVGWIERAIKWVRRRPVVASLTAAFVLALVLGTVVSTCFAVAATREAAETRAALAEADGQRRRAEERFRRSLDAVIQTALKMESPAYRDVQMFQPLRAAISEQAFRSFHSFIDETSSDPWVRLETGCAFIYVGILRGLQGDHDQAAGAFRKSVAVLKALADDHPRKATFRQELAQRHHFLGMALRRLGRLDDAREVFQDALLHYREAVRLAPDDHRGLNYLAWVLATVEDRTLRNSDEAVSVAERAVAVAPRNGSCLRTLGIARYTAGNNRGAVAALKESLPLCKPGGEVYSWLYLAMAHARLGDHDEARSWYKKARDWVKSNRADGDEIYRLLAEARGVVHPLGESEGAR